MGTVERIPLDCTDTVGAVAAGAVRAVDCPASWVTLGMLRGRHLVAPGYGPSWGRKRSQPPSSPATDRAAW